MSHKLGVLRLYWVLTVSDDPISCSDLKHLTKAEKATDKYATQIGQYDTHIKERLDAIGKTTDLTEFLA